MTRSVAVIVCAFSPDRAEQLCDAVRSLTHQTRVPDEVVVVIDGSAELTSLVEGRLRDVRLVTLPVRSGLATARNAGVARCSAETILFLDDDAVAAPDWVELLSSAVQETDTMGASGRSEPIWGAERPSWLADEFLWTVGCSYEGQPTRRARVRNVYGGCCGLRRELFTELGGYDARLGRSMVSAGGGEEAELCLRAQARWPNCGFTYEPAARISHHVPPERLTLRYVLRRAYDEGRMKARVSRLHDGGLEPERRFATALPLAVAKDLLRGILGKRVGFARAGGTMLLALAVLAGLAVGRSANDPERPPPALIGEPENVSVA